MRAASVRHILNELQIAGGFRVNHKRSVDLHIPDTQAGRGESCVEFYLGMFEKSRRGGQGIIPMEVRDIA